MDPSSEFAPARSRAPRTPPLLVAPRSWHAGPVFRATPALLALPRSWHPRPVLRATPALLALLAACPRNEPPAATRPHTPPVAAPGPASDTRTIPPARQTTTITATTTATPTAATSCEPDDRDCIATLTASTLPVAASDCGIPNPPLHTLAITPTGLRLGLTPQPDPATLRATLASLGPITLGLAIDASLRLGELRPVFAALRDLDGLRWQLAFRDARGGPDGRVRWHDITVPALEAVPAEPGPEPAIEPYIDVYYLRLNGELSRLHRAAEPRDLLPQDTTLPGQAQLRVAADDTQSWQTVAAALTRGCRGVQLIEPARVPTRKPDATSILDPPRPPSDPFGPPSVRQARPRVEGPLPRDIVRRIVRAHINEVRYCYLRGLNKNPELRGRVTVEFTIDINGKVRRSQIQTSTVADADVTQCTATATRRWTFPRPGGAAVTVTQDFTLMPP